MRCKKHAAAAGSGVCATCLRERLCVVMAAEAAAQVMVRDQSPRRCHRSSAATWLPKGGHPPAAAVDVGNDRKKTGRRITSWFWRLFGSGPDSDQGLDPNPGTGPGDFVKASPHWFSPIVAGRRREPGEAANEGTAGGGRKLRRDRRRGMSPERCSDEESSGYSSSESSQGWRQTPRRTAAPGRRCGGKTAGQCRAVSGLGFCLSPLVRASPNRQWNQKGFPPEMAGESRPPAKMQLSDSGSLCKNRSRKLADIGRWSHHNRRH
ncbi:uncharacterized protein LOC127263386 [Andrographis paniculata]|uniref:uncharacterized protein LOC127263386 n=1 Tax=Andrographis paniculata TaxID=175694 RepID=UPI0021E91E56|nr:uncharacterized protein LOC127263386 [Andrographis paniculata]